MSESESDISYVPEQSVESEDYLTDQESEEEPEPSPGSEVTFEYVQENIDGIVTYMKSLVPYNPATRYERTWKSKMLDPEIFESDAKYRAVINAYFERKAIYDQKNDLYSRERKVQEGERLLAEKILNQEDRLRSLEEKSKNWREINAIFRHQMITVLGKNEYNRWVSDYTHRFASFYAL